MPHLPFKSVLGAALLPLPVLPTRAVGAPQVLPTQAARAPLLNTPRSRRLLWPASGIATCRQQEQSGQVTKSRFCLDHVVWTKLLTVKRCHLGGGGRLGRLAGLPCKLMAAPPLDVA